MRCDELGHKWEPSTFRHDDMTHYCHWCGMGKEASRWDEDILPPQTLGT